MLTPVILAGGAGTRLWPVSRESEPKPFIRLYDGQTLLQKTLLRAAALDGVHRVVTVAAEELYHRTCSEYVGVKTRAVVQHDFLLEPCARNTAPAIAVAALHLLDADGPEALMLVMPADHVIQDIERFRAAVATAVRVAAEGCLVTFGIKPTSPETGYGYIELGPLRAQKIESTGDAASSEPPVFCARAFVEKPDLATAELYVSMRDHFWNAGIYCFRAREYLESLQRHAPDVHQAALACWQRSARNEAPIRLDATSFEAVRDVSVDYAVMEHGDNIVVVAGDFEWSDVGTWDAMSELVPADATGNRVEGDALLLGTSNCFVHSKARLAAVIGVDNLIVVDTPDALLVTDRTRVQDVKEVVRQLKSNGNGLCREHRTITRPWGHFTTLEEGEYFKVKHLTVKPGASLSLQMHRHRSEHWVVVRGAAKIVNGDDQRLLLSNESTYIPAGTVHQLSNPGVLDLVVIEVQSGQYLGEDDIVRLEDRYGRI